VSSLPEGVILTNAGGLARVKPGYVTVWCHDMSAKPGSGWTSQRGQIFFQERMSASGHTTRVPIFRADGSYLEDPLSIFDGFTQP
jgi:hypothetical protein